MKRHAKKLSLIHIFVRNNRVSAATCYLPLSDNMALNKNLGTRHRAGVGISEISDSLTIIVSEETGKVSYALNGELFKMCIRDRRRGNIRIMRFTDSSSG